MHNSRFKFTVLTHFSALRKRLLWSLFFFFSFWLIFMGLFPQLIPILEWPYKKAFPKKDLILVFTNLPEAIIAALKTTFFLALAITLPFLLYQFWLFLSPELYPQERKLIKKVYFVCLILFLAGLIGAYVLAFPILLKVFLGMGYRHFNPYLRIESYLSFLGKGLLVAGLIAQIPALVALIIKLDLFPSHILRKRWLYLVGTAYLLALFLSPGDFISQLILATLFYLLLELGFVLAKIL